jgi:hypothetical protein
MTKNADVWLLAVQKGSPVLRHLSAFVQNMPDGDAAACQFNDGLGRRYALFVIVDVA